MNCFYHPEKAAVAVCQVCGRGLCVSCADIDLTCPACRKARIRQSVNSAVKYLIALFVVGFIGYIWDFMGSASRSEGGLSAYLLMSICTGAFILYGQFQTGAKTLVFSDPASYLTHQLLNVGFKATLSFIIGAIATPIVIVWQIIILIINLIKLHRTR